MKKIIISLILFIGLSLSLSSATLNYQSSMANSASVDGPPYFDDNGYGDVYVSCWSDRCGLHCVFTGSLACNWANGFNGGCVGCEGIIGPNREDIANEANVQAMTDHAIDQAELNVLSGSYNSNLIVGSQIYYRTVVWDYDSTTKILDINVSVSFE